MNNTEERKKLHELICSMNDEQADALCGMVESLMNLANKKQKKDPDVQPEPEISPYEKNNTMRMLGNQCIMQYENDFQCVYDILEARGMKEAFKRSSNMQGTIIDVFMYGIITGKRAERARKKATTQATKLK